MHLSRQVSLLLFFVVLIPIFSQCVGLFNQINNNLAETGVPKDTAPEKLNENHSSKIYLPLVSNVTGQVYYISPSGDDSNPGSIDKPWRTIHKADSVILPGDIVYLRSGIYNEAPNISRGGITNRPVEYSAFQNEIPVIEGNGQLPGSFRGLINVKADWVNIIGLEVRNSRYIGIGLYGEHDLASRINAHHNQDAGIIVAGDYGTIENSRSWRNSLSNEFGKSRSWAAGITAARDPSDGITQYATIKNNEIWENWGEGIDVFAADLVNVEGNVTHDQFSANIYISDATNIVCQRNFVYNDLTSYTHGFGTQVGIMMGDETYNPPSANIRVINNIAFSNYVNYWWWQGFQGGGMKNVLIANNTFVNATASDVGEGGVIISKGDHSNVRFENNLVQQDGDLPVMATVYLSGIIYSHNFWSKTPYPAASGPGDIIGDPKLAKTGDSHMPNWFRLTSTSPAINRALSISEVAVDFFGHARGSSPDMGASEYLP